MASLLLVLVGAFAMASARTWRGRIAVLIALILIGYLIFAVWVGSVFSHAPPD